MGREIKRVPLDFKAQIGKVWPGFVNPLYVATKCEVCDGDGGSPTARRLKGMWYGHIPFMPEERGSTPFLPTDDAILAFAGRNVSHSPSFYGRDANAVDREARRLCALFNSQWCHHLNAGDVAALIAANRLWDFTRTWTRDHGWQDKDPPYVPTPREVNVWSISGLGHDSLNHWVCVRAECERLGVPTSCAVCDGEGAIWPSPEAKQAYEDWQPEKLPEGDGYQLWSTTTEGTPMTPVFATPEELARHCADNDVSTFGSDTADFATWLKFINGPGWAPSMVSSGAGVESGVAASVH